MNPENIMRALQLALSLMQAAGVAFEKANALITKARSEGRDITDAELDALASERDQALAAFKAEISS